METPKADRHMIGRALDTHRTDCADEQVLVRMARNAGFDDGVFRVGDEVISACGSVSGVILSISGDDALVSWSCRGKSVEPMTGLAHTEHDKG